MWKNSHHSHNVIIHFNLNQRHITHSTYYTESNNTLKIK